tara:strand:- start:369 stop:485 length:117 start_codon:yes stop_codon:yes gene_type:complete
MRNPIAATAAPSIKTPIRPKAPLIHYLKDLRQASPHRK